MRQGQRRVLAQRVAECCRFTEPAPRLFLLEMRLCAAPLQKHERCGVLGSGPDLGLGPEQGDCGVRQLQGQAESSVGARLHDDRFGQAVAPRDAANHTQRMVNGHLSRLMVLGGAPA